MQQNEFDSAIRQLETPFYLFDTDAACARVRALKAAFPHTQICYAMKANPFLVGALAGTADCFEVCSPGEFQICERAGLNMHQVVLSGVYKKPEDVDRVVRTYRGANLFTAESPAQWTLLARTAEKHGVPIRVMLRVTVGNQFGMDEAEVCRIIAERAAHPLVTLEGLQLFTATQRKNPQRMCKELQQLDALIQSLQTEYGYKTPRLEYGPGLPVRYFDDEPDFEPAVCQALRDALDGLSYRGPIVLELGRAVAATCGNYVTSVVDVKTNHSTNYCMVDGGIHQLNYFGQMMAMKRPPVTHIGAGGETADWTVCGALCTINDVLLKAYPMARPHVGDRLVFGRAGAYSVTEGTALFLSRELPQIFLYSEKDGLRRVRGHFQTNALNSAEPK